MKIFLDLLQITCNSKAGGALHTERCPEKINKCRKAKNNKTMKNRNIKKTILTQLRNESGLTLDVLKQKVAPEMHSINYYVQLLKREGLVTYQEGERPIRLYLTERGERKARPEQPLTRVVQATHRPMRLVQPTTGFVIPNHRSEIRAITAELAQKLMETAILFERLSRLQDDDEGDATRVAA